MLASNKININYIMGTKVGTHTGGNIAVWYRWKPTDSNWLRFIKRIIAFRISYNMITEKYFDLDDITNVINLKR